MCYCTKTRFYSHVRAHFRIISNQSKYDSSMETDYNIGKDIEISELVNGFISSLRIKSINAFYWLENIMVKLVRNKGKSEYVERMLETKYYNSKRPGFLIFHILYSHNFIATKPNAKKYVDICFNWYKKMKNLEQFLPVYHAVTMYLLEDKAVWEQPNSIEVLNGALKYLETYQPNLLNEVIKFDNYVLDKHTREGKKIGRNSVDFALEGSLVSYDINISPTFAQEYFQGHMYKGKASLESSEFNMKARSQLNTSGGKQDVYFAKTKKGIVGLNVVVKGPYLNIDQVMMPFRIQNIMKLFPEVNYYSVNIMVLYPDMYKMPKGGGKIVPLGIRNKIEYDKPYFFLVLEDVMNQDLYPTMTKSSKVWKDETVVDYEQLFKNNSKLDFAKPSNMNQQALFSLVIQLSFRIAFEIGDFAARNFVRVGDKVYNVDTEDIMVSTHWKWSQKDRELVNKCIKDNPEEYVRILSSWLDSGNSYTKRWDIVKRSLTYDYTEKIKDNIKILISNLEI